MIIVTVGACAYLARANKIETKADAPVAAEAPATATPAPAPAPAPVAAARAPNADEVAPSRPQIAWPAKTATPKDAAWDLAVRTAEERERVGALRDFLLTASDPDPSSLCEGCRVRFSAEERAKLAAGFGEYLTTLTAYETKIKGLPDRVRSMDDVQEARKERSEMRKAFFRTLDPNTLFALGKAGYLDTYAGFPTPSNDLLIQRPRAHRG
jgi:hypothetical protein